MENNEFDNNYRPEDYNPFAGKRDYQPETDADSALETGDGNGAGSSDHRYGQGNDYQGNGYQSSSYQNNGYYNNYYQESGNPGNGYQNNSYQNNSYQNNGYQNNSYRRNPYQENTFRHSYRSQTESESGAGSRPAGKRRTGNKGFLQKLMKTAAIALVFGLVSGSAFWGVNRVFNSSSSRQIGSTGSKSDTSSQTPVASSTTGNARELTDVSGIVEEVMPSIVAITNISEVTYQSFWGMQQSYEAPSAGSGFIIDQNDEYLYIATNNHVVENAKSLSVQFINETTVDAEIRGTYSSKDLAVVQVKKADIDADTMDIIKVATVGDSEGLKVGQPAIAIGNALGYGQSVTTGIISAKDRTITISDSSSRATVTNSNLLQTDAAINPGNSGGALLNAQGQVIGINSAKYSSTEVEGVGYAIPMEDAFPIIQALIQDGDYVNTHAAYLGISGADITSAYAQTYKMPEGIYVVEINDKAQAIEAGLHEGDIITAIDKKSVSSMDELKSVLVNYKAGDTVQVHVSRQNGRGYDELVLDIKLMSAKELNIKAQ